MKTQKFVMIFLTTLTISIFSVSCAKDRLNDAAVNYSDPSASIPTTGAIVDKGLVADNVRRVLVSLNNVSVSLTSATDGSNASNSSVSLEMYTNSDGIIPDGTYNFSNSTDYAPFTFASAKVSVMKTDNNTVQDFDVVGGAITLTSSYGTYTISISGQLSNGNSVDGNYNGTMSYMDDIQTN